jgi:ketosteroid isomerase-like protein
MPSSAEAELLDLSCRLLEAITAGDWTTYAGMCADDITCFEPEANGHLVIGLPFHKYYFDLPAGGSPKQSTIAGPSVRIIGDVGIVCYARLVQKLDANGIPVTVTADETRIWQKQGSQWQHIHFHRSPA